DKKFVKHPLDVVSVGDVVEVKVLSVDQKKKRISLTMKGIK
ncbi:MAG: S1 RNA-binding domain-containing protein, partial [Lachnospiraceae bacterium]|nr:S1 RNA-binding domain-containing protein [Lachnospiraceae bacterium]